MLALDDSHVLLTTPHDRFIEKPEAGRPPFDRVDRVFLVQNNSLGYRDRELPVTKPEGVRRVFVLGDSVSWGKGVEADSRFSGLLDRRWPGVEVHNLGVEGSTSIKVVRTLERFASYEPDLVILQASGNDLDLTAWRRATGSLLASAGVLATRLIQRSRLLHYGSFWLLGDPYDGQMELTRVAAAEHYAEALSRFFAICEEHRLPVLVLTLEYATGLPYGGHVADACREHEEVCLGVVAADFAGAGDWLDLPPSELDSTRPEPAWQAKVAESPSLDEDSLPTIFPYHRLFHDIVHPNARANRLIAEQLGAALDEHLGTNDDER